MAAQREEVVDFYGFSFQTTAADAAGS